MIDDTRPIFTQIADGIEGDIARGTLAEGAQAPSINELARFHRINPATAAKGINELVARGILVKRRGVGMFVADGAREAALARRRDLFEAAYITPLIAEARKLGISTDQLIGLIAQKGNQP